MAISKITNDGIGDIDELTVDTNTLVVDSANNRVGIGNSSPDTNLEISDTSGAVLRLSGHTGGAVNVTPYDIGSIEFKSNDTSSGGQRVVATVKTEAHTGSTIPGGELVFETCGASSSGSLAERMRIDSSGRVGIGTSSPGRDLHVVGDCFFDTYLDSSGFWETRKRTNLSLSSFASGANPTYDWNSATYSFKFTNYNNCLAITVGGTQNNRQANIQVGHSSPDTYAQYYGSLYLNKLGGTVYANTSSISDERYKTNLETVEDSLNKVTSLNGYTFYRTDVNTDLQQAGVIAQQVQEVFPCAVVYDEDEDKYAVSYDMLSALYIEAFKELKTKVETLETENQ